MIASRRLTLLILAFAFATPSLSQGTFGPCATRTGHNATLIVSTAVRTDFAGEALSDGDVIAVVTPQGRCAGQGVWRGKNLAISVAGDSEFTADKEGFARNEPLAFRIWDASRQVEIGAAGSVLAATFSSEKPYYRTDGRYADNAIYLLASLKTPMGTELPAAPSIPVIAGVESETDVQPEAVSLHAAYPNPFNPTTTIRFSLAEETAVTLDVVNQIGQRVKVISSGQRAAGVHEIHVDMDTLSSGLYFFRLHSRYGTQTRPLMLAR